MLFFRAAALPALQTGETLAASGLSHSGRRAPRRRSTMPAAPAM